MVHVSRWVVEHRLDKLKFARQKQAYCYLSAAADLFPPELSDARMSWAKNAFLTTVVDDFFDIDGSEEELINLIQLVEKYVIPFPFPLNLLLMNHFLLWLSQCSFYSTAGGT